MVETLSNYYFAAPNTLLLASYWLQLELEQANSSNIFETSILVAVVSGSSAKMFIYILYIYV